MKSTGNQAHVLDYGALFILPNLTSGQQNTVQLSGESFRTPTYNTVGSSTTSPDVPISHVLEFWGLQGLTSLPAMVSRINYPVLIIVFIMVVPQFAHQAKICSTF